MTFPELHTQLVEATQYPMLKRIAAYLYRRGLRENTLRPILFDRAYSDIPEPDRLTVLNYMRDFELRPADLDDRLIALTLQLDLGG